MKSWEVLHSEAMDLADQALSHRRRGEHKAAAPLFSSALDLERKALAQMGKAAEPLHSAMHRSCATLALDCGKYRLAEQLACKALGGEPPDYMLTELRDVVEQAWREIPF